MNALEQALDAKLRPRKQLAALPFEEKVAMVRKLRERAKLLESNPLRRRHPKKS
jgi:hypothetical protein